MIVFCQIKFIFDPQLFAQFRPLNFGKNSVKAKSKVLKNPQLAKITVNLDLDVSMNTAS